jgi:hypothetical protein
MQKSLRSVCAEKIVLTDELKVKTKGWKETKYKLDRAEGTHKQQIAITMAAQKNQLAELTSMIDALTTTVDELEEANSGGEKKDTGVAQLIDTVSEAGLHLAVAVTVATLCAITSIVGRSVRVYGVPDAKNPAPIGYFHDTWKTPPNTRSQPTNESFPLADENNVGREAQIRRARGSESWLVHPAQGRAHRIRVAHARGVGLASR